MRTAATGRIRDGIVGTHIALAISVSATLATVATAQWIRLCLIGMALAPLLLTLPGILRQRPDSLRWLALALVLYAGLGSVEVIATGTLQAMSLLLFALLELGLVLMLSRRLAPLSRGAPEES